MARHRLRLFDKLSGKKRWVSRAKDEWISGYLKINNKVNHRLTVAGKERETNFIHNTLGPKSAVHFRVDDGPYEGWYYLFDSGFNVYTSQYVFELIEEGKSRKRRTRKRRSFRPPI